MAKKQKAVPVGHTGWCSACIMRTGRKAFRFLPDGSKCSECLKKYPNPVPVPEPEPEPQNLVNPKAKYTRVNYSKELLREEDIFIEAFQKLKPKLRKYWIKQVAKYLGWSHDRASIVSRRIRNKGIVLESEPIEEQLLAKIKLKNKSVSCSEIASEFEFVDTPWICQILKKMVKNGKLGVIKGTIPFLYYIEEDSNAIGNN